MSYLSEQNTDSPLSRWQFEETSGTLIDDDLTTTRDGTLTGGVTLNQAAVFTDGALGATFNGTNGYISIGNMSGLLGIGTVEVIAQFNSVPTTSSANPLFTHSYTSGKILPLVIGFDIDSTSPGKLQAGYFTGSVWQTVTWSTSPTTGVPYYIAGTYDGTTLSLYVNGSVVATSTPSTARPGSGTPNATAYIGRRWDSAQYHNGTIWDLALYSTALSTTRLDAHYATLVNVFSDSFASAGTLFNGVTVTSLDTTAWTTEGSEPGGIFNTGWAQYTPSISTNYHFDTIGSNYDTVINVYTGASLAALTLVATDDNSGGSGTSSLNVALTAGTTYYVQVGAKTAGGGLLYFTFYQNAAAQLAAVSAESLTNNTPSVQLAGVGAEILTNGNGIPIMQLDAITLEILVPSRLGFEGWGMPIKNLNWP